MIEKVRNRKVIKAIGLATIILVTGTLYFLFFFSNLKVTVFNKTGYDIDSLKLGNKFYTVKKGDSLLIDNCNNISLQDDLPFGLPQADIEGKSKDTFQLFFCGTGVRTIKNGQYKFDISISEDNSFYRLYWRQHK